MKIASRIFSVLLIAALLVTMFAGCGKVTKEDKVTESGEVLTIRVHYHSSGYGHSWLQKAAEAFEAAYANTDTPYEVELTIEMGTSQISAEQQIPLGPEKNDMDLYYGYISLHKVLDASNKTMRGEGSVLLDLTDIFNAPAVNGKLESETKTIKDRYYGNKEDLLYDGLLTEYHGGIYALPQFLGTTGIILNTAVTDRLGITELPLTSDEFIKMNEDIYAKGVKPFGYPGANAPAYWMYLWANYFAQYSGVDGFMNWVATNPESGDIINDGWKVYEDKGILEAFKAMDPFLKLDYCPNGSVNNTHLEAQHDVLSGEAAYIVSGDWVFNEMEQEYYNEGANCILLKTPVLSVIGTESGITDAELHTAVKMIDEGKSDADIMAAISGLDAEETKRIRDARGIFSGGGTGSGWMIPAYADAAEGAKKFIQFMFSEDGCRIIRDEASAFSIVTCDSYETVNDSKFMDSVMEFVSNGNGTPFDMSENRSPVRSAAGMLWFNHSAYVHQLTFKTMMTDDGKITPEFIYETEIDYVRTNWAQWVAYTGMT